MARLLSRIAPDSLPRISSLALMATAVPLLLLISGCGAGSISWQPMAAGETQAEVRGLLDRVIEAHGGDAWAEVSDVDVSYEGSWGKLVPKMQPVLSDRFFRRASRELYWPSKGVIAQEHRGPAGEKRVLRRPDSVEVSYRNEGEGSFRPADSEEQAASALVADAYALFLFGPSFISHRAETLELLPDDVLDGRPYRRLLASLRPGFGTSEEDRVVMWIDAETLRLYRVLFSLEGFESTRGAEVDVTFPSYREQAGYWWPDEFRERVRAPVRAFAHAWRTVELRVGSEVPEPDDTWARGVGELVSSVP